MSKLFSWNALAVFALAFPAGIMAQNAPVVGAIINNYSGVLPALPNYGIAPGSIFVLYGTNLSDNVPLVFQSSVAPGLPLTLNHTSISVTVNGTTTNAAIYYATAGQVAAVLPSTTPAGSGTLKLTYNGQTSSVPITVTASAFGLATLNGAGTGGILATDADYHLITPTASAAPGQTIVMWGSGLGADTANNDRTYPNQQDNLNNAAVYIGGVKANVAFAGRSAFPGVDQINVTIPTIGTSGFQAGCGLAVAVVAGGKVSNFGTVAVNPGNGVCSDPLYGITGTQLTESGTQPTVSSGFVSLIQATLPSNEISAARSHAKTFVPLNPKAQTFTTVNEAIADFSSESGGSFVAGTSFLSLGSCIVDFSSSSTGTVGTFKGLDAGTITLAGGGINTTLTSSPFAAGDYFAQLTTALMGSTAYTFTGSGGKDVGPFSVTVNFPTVLTWTNENSISTVTESQGQLITWTGGAPGTYLDITGNSSSGDGSASADFICLVPVNDQQFTIPSYVLSVLPPGNGQLGIYNATNPVSFTATGINYGTGASGFSSSENVTYQ
jgi:uncharacterized protein (TIGR03437 family)